MKDDKDLRSMEIQMISIDRINILNPRVRNQKVFFDIATNITQVGLKRPITVTHSKAKIPDKDYDLICGQGRLEAYLACGQTHIPAIVIDADEERSLIMSLVENLARRQRRPGEVMKGIEILQKQGYDAKQIAEKTGLSLDYTQGVLSLLDQGEQRLLLAVETGKMPMVLAIHIMNSPGNEQRALQEAYESKQFRGNKFLLVKKLIDLRKFHGKSFEDPRRSKNGGGEQTMTVQYVLKVYQREVDRKRLITRKADMVNNRLRFVVEAFRQLLKDGNFNNLLRAEGLNTLPKPLTNLMEEKALLHG